MLTSAANLPLPQGLHGGFDSWPGDCEAKLAQPVKTQRNPVGTRKNWRYVSDDREERLKWREETSGRDEYERNISGRDECVCEW